MIAVPDDLILAATAWATNAQMIRDVAKLGYLKHTDLILDPTYGAGGWWRLWHPLEGAIHGFTPTNAWYWPVDNEFPLKSTLPGPWDFRDMGVGSEVFDAVAFDPPYVSVGGRATSGIRGMHDAYGMGGAPTTPQGVQTDIAAGLKECFRVVKKGGIVLVKCQSYVSSGKLWPGTFLTYQAAMTIGFQLVDHFVHVSGPRPQPDGRGPQKHARRNQSDLLVLRRPNR